MRVYAVIDTNVFVSALLTRNAESATAKVLEALFDRKIISLYNDVILREYNEVLHRGKFVFPEDDIDRILNTVKTTGVLTDRMDSGEQFPDPDDAVFYEVALSKDGAYVVTGNTKHFPRRPIVVTPAEMVEILGL
ncbi:MAG: putative toxin-antitoxin system toxin component, PIN family [Bacteroidales bacterium]|nr:putative toxin-antitoxin system toxin component, PIN family [Bacteroidales bacterium]